MLFGKFASLMLLAFLLAGLPSAALARDLSTVQTALRIVQEEMQSAKKEHDVDMQRVAATEKEIARLKKQLEAEQKKAAQSEQRLVEAKKRHDKAQAELDQAWKR